MHSARNVEVPRFVQYSGTDAALRRISSGTCRGSSCGLKRTAASPAVGPSLYDVRSSPLHLNPRQREKHAQPLFRGKGTTVALCGVWDDAPRPVEVADPPALRGGPAAWRGTEMASRRHEWLVALSEEDVAEVERAVAGLLADPEAPAQAQAQEAVLEVAPRAEEAARAHPVTDAGRRGVADSGAGDRSSGGEVGAAVGRSGAESEVELRRRLARLTPDQFPLPTLGLKLQALREELLHGRGFVLLRRLPVEKYTQLQAAAAFLGLGCHLGSARSQNARGHVLGHVADLGLSSDDPRVRIYQTSERQTFHTDSCDVVGLLCLREAKEGGDSLLVSAETLYDEMRRRAPALLRRLLEPMPHDRRGEVPAGQLPFFDIPVFSWHEGYLSIFYQRQYFDSAQRFPEARRLTEEDIAALDALDALANDPSLHLTMRLAPGDMQFVHNHNMLHDRTGFVDWPDPARRRHLLRLWIATPGARPLPPAFAARYGSLEVGNRGGIMVPGMQMQVPLHPE